MADRTTGTEGEAGSGPVVRDRRKIDPETGRVREAYAAHSGPPQRSGTEGPAAADRDDPAGEAGPSGRPDPSGWEGPAGRSEPAGQPVGDGGSPAGADEHGGTGTADGSREVETENQLADQLAADLVAARTAAEDRLADLQRLQAEYVNYRRRVDRDRDVARDLAVAGVLEALLPVLDDVHLARQHGDLESGPFSAIAEKLESTLARIGLSRYGEPGETFDPNVHEALMHTEADLAEGTTEPTVVQVLQPGYRVGERVLRPARVAVADPG